MTVPTAIPTDFLNMPPMATATSGRLVPKPIINIPIIDCRISK
jgi:hypothetical protein